MRVRIILPLIYVVTIFLSGCQSTCNRGALQDQITLMHYNIHTCIGNDEKIDMDRIAGILKGADIISLNEVDQNCIATEFSDQPKYLSEKLGMKYWHFAPILEASNKAKYGVMLLSKYPFKSVKVHTLYHTIGREPRRCVEARVLINNKEYTVLITHLECRVIDVRRQQIKEILEIVGTNPKRLVLMGDLNECLPGEEPENYRGAPDMMREVSIRLKDTAVLTGATFTNTYAFTNARIDYVFVSADIASDVKSYRVIKDSATEVASDHYPVEVVLDI